MVTRLTQNQPNIPLPSKEDLSDFSHWEAYQDKVRQACDGQVPARVQEIFDQGFKIPTRDEFIAKAGLEEPSLPTPWGKSSGSLAYFKPSETYTSSIRSADTTQTRIADCKEKFLKLYTDTRDFVDQELLKDVSAQYGFETKTGRASGLTKFHVKAFTEFADGFMSGGETGAREKLRVVMERFAGYPQAELQDGAPTFELAVSIFSGLISSAGAQFHPSRAGAGTEKIVDEFLVGNSTALAELMAFGLETGALTRIRTQRTALSDALYRLPQVQSIDDAYAYFQPFFNHPESRETVLQYFGLDPMIFALVDGAVKEEKTETLVEVDNKPTRVVTSRYLRPACPEGLDAKNWDFACELALAQRRYADQAITKMVVTIGASIAVGILLAPLGPVVATAGAVATAGSIGAMDVSATHKNLLSVSAGTSAGHIQNIDLGSPELVQLKEQELDYAIRAAVVNTVLAGIGAGASTKIAQIKNLGFAKKLLMDTGYAATDSLISGLLDGRVSSSAFLIAQDQAAGGDGTNVSVAKNVIFQVSVGSLIGAGASVFGSGLQAVIKANGTKAVMVDIPGRGKVDIANQNLSIVHDVETGHTRVLLDDGTDITPQFLGVANKSAPVDLSGITIPDGMSPRAMQLACERARQTGRELSVFSDPQNQRVIIQDGGENQTASVLRDIPGLEKITSAYFSAHFHPGKPYPSGADLEIFQDSALKASKTSGQQVTQKHVIFGYDNQGKVSSVEITITAENGQVKTTLKGSETITGTELDVVSQMAAKMDAQAPNRANAPEMAARDAETETIIEQLSELFDQKNFNLGSTDSRRLRQTKFTELLGDILSTDSLPLREKMTLLRQLSVALNRDGLDAKALQRIVDTFTVALDQKKKTALATTAKAVPEPKTPDLSPQDRLKNSSIFSEDEIKILTRNKSDQELVALAEIAERISKSYSSSGSPSKQESAAWASLLNSTLSLDLKNKVVDQILKSPNKPQLLNFFSRSELTDILSQDDVLHFIKQAEAGRPVSEMEADSDFLAALALNDRKEIATPIAQLIRSHPGRHDLIELFSRPEILDVLTPTQVRHLTSEAANNRAAQEISKQLEMFARLQRSKLSSTLKADITDFIARNPKRADAIAFFARTDLTDVYLENHTRYFLEQINAGKKTINEITAEANFFARFSDDIHFNKIIDQFNSSFLSNFRKLQAAEKTLSQLTLDDARSLFMLEKAFGDFTFTQESKSITHQILNNRSLRHNDVQNPDALLKEHFDSLGQYFQLKYRSASGWMDTLKSDSFLLKWYGKPRQGTVHENGMVRSFQESNMVSPQIDKKGDASTLHGAMKEFREQVKMMISHGPTFDPIPPKEEIHLPNNKKEIVNPDGAYPRRNPAGGSGRCIFEVKALRGNKKESLVGHTSMNLNTGSIITQFVKYARNIVRDPSRSIHMRFVTDRNNNPPVEAHLRKALEQAKFTPEQITTVFDRLRVDIEAYGPK